MTTLSLEAKEVEPLEEKGPPATHNLWQPYHETGDAGVENALVERYLPLVRTVVGRVALSLPAHVRPEDLHSAGLVGLLQAIRSYDATAGASFETFARFRIRGAVLDELRRLDWVPRLVHEKARRIQNVLNELEQQLGQSPGEEEVANALGLTPGEYRDWLEEIRPVAFVCLDACASADTPDGTTQHESIPDNSQPSPFDSASGNELKELIARRIRQLPQSATKSARPVLFRGSSLAGNSRGLRADRIAHLADPFTSHSCHPLVHRAAGSRSSSARSRGTRMIILVGAMIVLASVAGGFIMAGGHFYTLMHLSELVIIGGAALGAVVIMAPKRVLIDLLRSIVIVLKGTPYNRRAYDELFQALYELFQLGRRSGLIALEEHLTTPSTSSIFQRYPGVLGNHEALEFLCGALRPVMNGRVKPDQLRHLLETDLERMVEESEGPITVLNRAADAMPGFGIVAAVLGIVITMASIAGPIEQIGIKVAAALVGTFLGIFLGYGFLSPLAVNMEFNVSARLAYFRCISSSVVSFASGMAPGMAIEVARRSLSEDLRPGADELEAMLKALAANAAKSP